MVLLILCGSLVCYVLLVLLVCWWLLVPCVLFVLFECF